VQKSNDEIGEMASAVNRLIVAWSKPVILLNKLVAGI
jgi:HAMP domain-containing protein